MNTIEEQIIVIVDPRRPMGVDESPSGARAFYINVTRHDAWPEVESHQSFLQLSPHEQDTVRAMFTTSLERYLFIFETK